MSEHAQPPKPPGRRVGLGTKLIAFSVLWMVAVVCVAFFLLSFELRRRTKNLLAQTVAHHQKILLDLQQQSLQDVLRTSTLMTDNPTLRAAMETYQAEAAGAPSARPDLLETIRTEAGKVARGLGKSLLIVTDRDGRVLADSGAAAWRVVPGEDLSRRSIVRAALDVDHPVGPANFSVLELRDEHYQAGAAPVLLQGFVIGALIVGERLDQEFVEQLRASFDSEFAIVVSGKLVGSTVDIGDADLGELRGLARLGNPDPLAPDVARIGSEEFVTASIVLGNDGGRHGATLFQLQSLTRALREPNRSLLVVLIGCGLAAVLLSALAAGWMARSVLRPLDQFVGFMRSVAGNGDHSRRFRAASGCAEVETLADAYHQLMQSLQAHEERLLRSAREDLDRLARLQESEKLAALGRMLSGAAHEINNPLAGVVGNLEILLNREEVDPATRRRLERIHADGRRVVALVRNLLRISHRETDERVANDLNQLVRQAADVRRHDFAAAGVELRLELDPHPVQVLGSELELQQVMLNIVNNAFDALSGRAPSPSLVIRTATTRGEALVVFEDNGPGMHDPERVFEHFYTTKRVGQGTGLGLSISQAIVAKHDGSIRAENVAGGGARFSVRLPALHSAAQAVAVAVAAPAPENGPLAARVLVVDDEPTLVELQREILESLGASVTGAGSGSEAIDRLEAQSFDIVVSDLKMPGSVNGRELFHWVQTHRPQASRAFVFVTGDTALDASRDFMEQAGARFLWKPLTLAEYVDTLREVHRDAQNG